MEIEPPVSTSTRPSITKPRKSQLILEGAAAAVSSVLLLWLFLWFVHQHQAAHKVVNYYLPMASGGVAPHLVADARGLARSEDWTSIKASESSGFSTKVADAAASQVSPMVISISAPMVAGRGDGDVAELIKKVAREAGDDVLIVLDLAQIDSDRDLGVFGNAPCANLKDQLAKEDPTHDVFVLLSCAPGQKSWMIDGLGRSAFSYFLQRGLEGEAKTDNGRGGKTLTVEGLHRFVLRNTAAWASANRRGAIQTPLLLAVGPKSTSFVLPRFEFKKSGDSAPLGIAKSSPPPPKGPSPETTPKDAQAKSSPKSESTEPKDRRELLDSLLKQWAEREKLEGGNHPPFREAPARWRIYEASLLRAERLVRASWNDPNLRDEAEIQLRFASQRHDELLEAIEEATKSEDHFPFHPAGGDPEGKQVLNASLKYLTGIATEELAVAMPAAPPTGGGAVGPGKVNLDKSVDPLPPQLEQADLDRPSRYLELQLPAWSYRFQRAFGVETFKEDRRGGLLREAVLGRLPAESALAIDRRGLSWIERDIREGDATRRAVQDDLFGVVDPADIKGRIADYGKKYADALERIGRFHEGRMLFESLAARLPYYGVWAVLDDLREEPGASPFVDGTSSPRLVEVFRQVGRLADLLENEVEPEDLSQGIEQARASFERLKDRYRKRVEALAAGERAAPWLDLDDVLSTPLIRSSDRKRLLEEILKAEDEAPRLESVLSASGGQGAATDPEMRPDTGFLRKALGLARLDVELRRLGAGGLDPSTGTNAEGLKEIEPLDATLRRIVELGPGKSEVLDEFAKAGEQARRISAAFVSRRARSSRELKVPERDIAKEVRAADRACRFRTVEELRGVQSDADVPAKDLEAFSRRSAIRFHAERLAQDFARNVDSLNALAKDEFPVAEARSIPFARGYLTTDTPSGPIPIDLEKRSGLLEVGVRAEDESGSAKIPEGRAFVGVLVLEPKNEPKVAGEAEAGTSKEEAMLRVQLADSPLRLGVNGAGGLTPVDGKPHPPLAFRVDQLSNVEPDFLRKPLLVKVFYRGRVDERGRRDQVDVACRNFGPAVVVKIAQDYEPLKAQFGEARAALIIDQFREHPGEGYLHCRGRLDYLMTFANKKGEPLEMVIEQTWSTEGGEPGPPTRSEIIRLDRDGFFPIRGKLEAANVAIGTTKVLNVRVLDPKTNRPIVRPEKFRFRQLAPEDYLVFSPEPVQADARNNGTLQNCFRITVIRISDEKVTVPIRIRDIQFSIGDADPPQRRLDEDDFLTRENNRIRTTYEIPPGVKVIKWRVVVEGEVKTGDFPVR
jgi:hypothetical protein